MSQPFTRTLTVGLMLGAIASAYAQTEARALTKDQTREFLLNAKIVQSKQLKTGVTHPWRLTLSDGTFTHDALFQSIDEHKSAKQFDSARGELNFVDSWHYNIAAYGIAELLGLDAMMPMYVERRWQGKMGSVGWWIEATMDEDRRLKEGKKPPDAEAWNHQMYRMRVFSQLVYDSDRNLTNVLITDPWKVWMIDFTRAFRLWPDLASTKESTWRPWGAPRHSVRTGEPAFDHVFAMPIFEYFAKMPESAAVFDAAMTSISTLESKAVVAAYNFSGINTLVDVAGGHGLMLVTILKANRRMRGILFDLSHVTAGATALLQSGGVADGCHIVSGDFFASVPEGADDLRDKAHHPRLG